MSEALQGLENSQMIAHEIAGKVRKITYENGVSLYVNYGYTEAVMEDVHVPGMGYIRIQN